MGDGGRGTGRYGGGVTEGRWHGGVRAAGRRGARAGAVVAALALVGGCAATVPVQVAPDAHDPVCAEVVLRLPDELDGMPRLRTDAQATVAWGETTAPVVLRCGVDPLPPTTDACVTAEDDRASVDWVAVPGEADDAGNAPWTFTTYGRTPAFEVVVPAAVTATRSTSFLVDLGPAIARVAATRTCL